MATTFKCKTVTAKKASNDVPYYAVETEDGKKFNVFDEAGQYLETGIEFTCDLTQEGKFLNVVKDTFAVNMSTKRTPSTKPTSGRPMGNNPEEDRQCRIEAQNALTNLTNLAIAHKLNKETEDHLIIILKERAGC